MIWQDILMGITGFGYALVLIPTIRKKSRVPKITSVGNIVLLALNGLSLATLNLWAASASILLTLIAWLVILIRK